MMPTPRMRAPGQRASCLLRGSARTVLRRLGGRTWMNEYKQPRSQERKRREESGEEKAKVSDRINCGAPGSEVRNAIEYRPTSFLALNDVRRASGDNDDEQAERILNETRMQPRLHNPNRASKLSPTKPSAPLPPSQKSKRPTQANNPHPIPLLDHKLRKRPQHPHPHPETRNRRTISSPSPTSICRSVAPVNASVTSPSTTSSGMTGRSPAGKTGAAGSGTWFFE